MAPYKTFVVKSNYRFGISSLMKQRDVNRELKIKKTKNSEKIFTAENRALQLRQFF